MGKRKENGDEEWWEPMVQKILEFLWEKGKEIIFATIDKLSKKWRSYFKGKTVLILGDKQTGKTALLLFMEHGTPHEIKDGKKTPPNPTSGVVITDKKFKASEGNLHIKSDVAGDRDFRSCWSDLLKRLSPEGVIYMIDGRKDDGGLRAAIEEMFRDFLDCCDAKLRRPHTVHIFLNFADIWMISEQIARAKARYILELYDKFSAGKSNLTEIQIEVSPTSLDPMANNWPQAIAALHKFGSALVGKSSHGR